MTLANHEELVTRLLGLKGKAMLSGYAYPAYAPLEEAGWVRKDWRTACYAAGKTRPTGIQGEGAALRMQPRTESVWISPTSQAQGELTEREDGHDRTET